MRPTSEIITPHQGCLASRKDTLRLVHVAYLVFHNKARAPDSDDTYPDLDGIRTHQRQQIGTGNFFDEHTIMMPIGACLNARIVRRVGNNTFCLLMFLARRPLLQPLTKFAKIMESCFLKIGKVDSIIHMGKGIKVAKANLYGTPVREFLTHYFTILSPYCSHAPGD